YEELSLRFVPTLTQSIPKQSLNELAVAASESRVAVLTRTNLEAFQLSEWARSQRIETVVRVRQSYWPAWMARLLFGLRGDYISSAHLRSLWKHHGLEGVGNIAYEDAETLWEESGLFRRGSLDLVAVGDYLRSHVPAPELDKPGLVVTTIHQSKGLEYDSVALLAPTTHANLGGQADELRVLYVAATRAKRHLSLLERDGKIFRWGKKGQKSIYNHFHRYTNLENWFLLNTKESFSFKNFWYCPPAFSRSQWIQRIEQTQQDWWDQFKIDGHWQVPWTLKRSTDLEDGTAIFQPSPTLFHDLAILHRGFGVGSSGVLEAPVTGLVTVAGPPDCDPAVFGTARLAIIPWVFGWAKVVAEGEKT
ncbi:MAG: 3'-5' exonuclease, partial [Sulfobacillus sp.]